MVQSAIRTGTVPVMLTETHSHDVIAAQAAGRVKNPAVEAS